MKKFLFSIFTFVILCSTSCYAETETISILKQNGFFDRPKTVLLSPQNQLKKKLCSHLTYSNSYDLKGLMSIYADKYISGDGFNKDIFFELVKKTWESYPDIKYKSNIGTVNISGDFAAVEVFESAQATTASSSEIVPDQGTLESRSHSIYYFEKIGSDWLVTSDYIISEQTFLRYGSAKDAQIELEAPYKVSANQQYSTSLKMIPPKDSLVIASIGKERITHPQTIAEEVFRKLPQEGVLERLFIANNDNINEYIVSSFGITKAELKKGTELKIYITGLGFGMTRVNVIPENKFVKADKNEKID